MTAQINLVLNERNDETINLTLLQPDGITPYDLTSAEVDFYIKPSAASEDTDIDVIKLSTTGGGVVVTSPPTAGLATVTIPTVDLQTPATRFWRVDVIAGGQKKTAMFGLLQINDL